MAVNGTHGFDSKKKKTYTDKTKLNPAARDDTLRSEDTKQSVCARNWTVYHVLPLIRHNVQLSWARSQQPRDVSMYSGVVDHRHKYVDASLATVSMGRDT